jgi:cell division protein FtsB
MMTLILIVLLIALMIPLTAVVLDSQVGRAIAARLERGQQAVDEGERHRLERLEADVQLLTRQVERLEEESTFLQKLLEEKRRPDPLPPGDDAA